MRRSGVLVCPSRVRENYYCQNMEARQHLFIKKYLEFSKNDLRENVFKLSYGLLQKVLFLFYHKIIFILKTDSFSPVLHVRSAAFSFLASKIWPFAVNGNVPTCVTTQ